MEIVKCKECGKELKPLNGKRNVNPKRQFCTHLCRARYHSKKNYYLKRDSPSFRYKQREYYKKWYEKNREKHKKYIRDYYERKIIEMKGGKK